MLPIVSTLAGEGMLVSIDTMKPEVMREAVAAGAAMINDVRALRESGALEVAAATDAAVCLMHMRGTPRTMQQSTRYDDVVAEVRAFPRFASARLRSRRHRKRSHRARSGLRLRRKT